MHGVSVHSALAIKRQRKRRTDHVVSRDRRYSDHRRPSLGAESGTFLQNQPVMPRKVMSTLTASHIGVIFIVIGLFFLTGALVPSEQKRNMKDLIGTGVTLIVIGIFLIVINQFYGQREEDELTNYVESRLARTKSGTRLYRDEESMCEVPEGSGGSGTPGSKNLSNPGKKLKANKKQPIRKPSQLQVVNETQKNSSRPSRSPSRSRSVSNTSNVSARNGPNERVSPRPPSCIEESVGSESAGAGGESGFTGGPTANRSTDLYRVYDTECSRAGA